MQEEKPLTEEMVHQIIEMRAKGRHESASRLQQAEQRGIKKGKEEGKEESIKEGKEEGIKESGEKEKISIAKNMLKLNFPIEAISQVTGLTASEIEKLKQLFFLPF